MDFAQIFDLTNGDTVLRIVCGVFLIPHLIVKFRNQEFSKGFMASAGLKPPALWMYAALVVELVASIGLIFDIYTFYAAILAGIFLLTAAYAAWRVSEGKWQWNFGGMEYPLFWSIACFVVAMNA
jgi:putative oxidoreductase